MHWARGVRAWSWRVVALLLAYFAVSVARADPGSSLLLTAGVVMVVVAAHLAVSGSRWWDVGLLLLALGAALWHDASTPVDTAPRPALLVLICLLVVAGCGRPWRHSVPVAVLAGAAYVAAATGPVQLALLEALNAVAAGVGASVVTRSLALSAARSDRALAEQQAVHAARVDRSAADAAATETRRLLHDELVATLALLRLQPPAPVATEAATTALAKLDAFAAAGTAGTADTAAFAATLHGVVVTVENSREDPIDALPHHVWTALSAATHEALRNVARHSGVGEATLVLRGDADQVDLEVVDRGAGFDPAERAGIGLTESVVQRMADVGGRAVVDSVPGRGTTVALSWVRDEATPPQATGRWQQLHEAVGDLRVTVAAYPVIQLVLGVALAAALPGPSPVASLALAAAVVLATLLVVRHAVLAPLRGAIAALAVVVPPTATGLGLALAGPGALRGFESWIVGLAEVPVIVLALVASWRLTALTAVVTSGTVVVAAALDPTLSPGDVPGPVIQPAMYAVLFWLLGTVAGRVGASARRAHEATLDALLQRARTVRRRHALEQRLGRLDDRVRALLGLVADERLDAAVAAEAGLLAHALRDELVAPDALDDASRDLVEQVRRAGGNVSLRPGLGPAHRPHLAPALQASLAEQPVAVAVVVSPGAGPEAVEVAVWPSDEPDVAS